MLEGCCTVRPWLCGHEPRWQLFITPRRRSVLSLLLPSVLLARPIQHPHSVFRRKLVSPVQTPALPLAPAASHSRDTESSRLPWLVPNNLMIGFHTTGWAPHLPDRVLLGLSPEVWQPPLLWLSLAQWADWSSLCLSPVDAGPGQEGVPPCHSSSLSFGEITLAGPQKGIRS